MTSGTDLSRLGINIKRQLSPGDKIAHIARFLILDEPTTPLHEYPSDTVKTFKKSEDSCFLVSNT
jgi:hypothetical protein